MFKFRANLCFNFNFCKYSAIKITILDKNVFEIRDLMSKKCEITDFKHNLIQSKQLFQKTVISLHQKKILMVKVYG